MNNDLISLIPELIQKTDSGNLKWKPTSKKTAFLLSFDDYSIVIDDISNNPMITTLGIAIIDSKGNIVDNEAISILVNPEGHKALNLLYQKARNSALNIDTAIQSIRSKLKSIK